MVCIQSKRSWYVIIIVGNKELRKEYLRGKNTNYLNCHLFFIRRKTIGELSGVYKYKIVKKAEELQRILVYLRRWSVVFIC